MKANSPNITKNNVAINIASLSKVYKLYDKHIDRLKEALNPFRKQYHQPFFALKNINLQVGKGEILGIVGRNGAGKSTLIKIISGVLTQTQGTCRVQGRISSLLSMASGFNMELTGIENIYLNGTIKGFSKKEMDDRLDAIISFAEIGGFIHQPVKTYSSGMQARLSFSVAIHVEPDILILDEVLSVGDELFRRKCYAKMEELFKSGCTVLFVSHSIGSINEICSRAILLDQGENILDGSPKLVTMHYQKLLYVKPENQSKFRDEIISLNNNITKKNAFSENQMNLEEKHKTEKPEPKETPEISNPEPDQKPFFIPNFTPKSTVHYKNHNVDIKEVQIKTLEGERVNALVLNENYIYSYKIKFNIEAENVIFGMAIKNKKGTIISSARTGDGFKRYGNMIEYIPKGHEYLLEWHFKCAMLPGTYYTNIGVKNFPANKEPVMLNRITDALVFKVQTVPQKMIGGMFHLNQSFNITLLDLVCKK